MKTRFAPSPTGYLHLGNARTALFNYFIAKHTPQGQFILRIEDTDLLRSTPEFALQLQKDLRWLGLEWDLGPNKAHHLGPYVQTKRHTIYAPYYQKLIEQGVAYPCFCTEAELTQHRLHQQSQGKPPRYSGICRALSLEEIAAKQRLEIKASLRLRVPAGQTLIFNDLVKGIQVFNSDVLSDFIIRKSEGSPSFLFCNAIDDALMGVTHVVRGEDHLSNTPKQCVLFQYLNLPIPYYLHLPLITQADTTPLAKRQGSFSLKKLRSTGYLPSALHNYLARLGHTIEVQAFMTLAQLTRYFSISKLHKSSAQFDEVQLRFWQKQAVQAQSQEAFWQWVGAETKSLVPDERRAQFVSILQPMILFPSEALEWAQCLFIEPLIFSEPIPAALTEKNPIWGTILNGLSLREAKPEALILELKQRLKNTPPDLRKLGWQSLRLALTGRLAGPELADIISILGFERSYNRLEAMIRKMNISC